MKLAWVEGEGAAEFADLIGATGTLRPGQGKRLVFMPAGRGDWLTMETKEATERDGTTRVATLLGNVFVFRPARV